ncbi:MAG: NCS2 family permease [Peptoniphilus sp.]|uniref:NCS2 family permease n=1 Tax=Peptoniphilus sp. TaxID=1971214 RepID=UPI002A752D33|nr:NCS2 family permease [Peptoniphilus sp.]MDY2987863.1 NCS2 family permease [Peptoniphilus sp.]
MKKSDFLDRLFDLSGRNTSVKTEVFAGITTFMTIAYILAVIPGNLSETGIPRGAVFTATIISTIFATLIAGLYANLPFVFSTLLGFDSFFVFSIVFGMGKSWQFALTSVLIAGIILTILTIFKVRITLSNVIPMNLKIAMVVGLGLFVTFIGLKNAGIVEAGGAILKIGDITKPEALLALFGIIVLSAMNYFKIKGSFLITIIGSTVVAIVTGITSLPENIVSLPPSFMPTAFKFVGTEEIFTTDMAVCVFVFIFMSIFNNIGTVTGLSIKAGLTDENNEAKDMNKSFLVDSLGTIVAGCLGTSVVGTTLETSAGIEEGGRTGLMAVTSALMFVLALFFSPLFLIVPSAAITPVLVTVGLSMTSAVKAIDFDNITEAIPAFLTFIIIPLTYSIADGIMIGILSYVVLNIITGKFKQISLPMYAMGILSLVKMLFL